MGVIDSLTKGFQNVHKRWWVLLIPVLLDVFLWIGPHASVDHLLQGAMSTIDVEKLGLSSSLDASVDLEAALDRFASEVLPRYNGFSALRIGSLGLPSLVTWGSAREELPPSYEAMWVAFLLMTDLPDMLLSSYESMWVVLLFMIDMPDLLTSMPEAAFLDVPVWQLPSEGVWLLTTLSLALVGIVVGSAYITILSRTVDPEGTFWSRMARLSVRFALFWGLRFVLLVAAGIPLVMIWMVLAAVSPGLAFLFGIVISGLLTWLSFYGIFLVAALAVNDVSIWRAIWNSFNVVLRNFWATFALFALINLIGGGLTILWQQVSTGSWLTFLGILGHAYVGSALIVASMIFYQDRYERWQAILAELLRRTQRLA